MTTLTDDRNSLAMLHHETGSSFISVAVSISECVFTNLNNGGVRYAIIVYRLWDDNEKRQGTIKAAPKADALDCQGFGFCPRGLELSWFQNCPEKSKRA